MTQREETGALALSVQIILRIVGIWPGASYALLFRCAWLLTTCAIQICEFWWIIFYSGTDDMSHLMDGLSVTMEYTMMLLKLIILWLGSRTFYDALAAMTTDWEEAAISDVHIMASKANLSRRISNMIIGTQMTAVFLFGIDILVFYIDNYDADATETPAREFSVKMHHPFECNESPVYEFVSCLEFLHQLTSSAIIGTLNSLIITLVLHASGQIDILCNALREISSEKSNQYLAVSIAKLIGKHQRIINFSNKIERLFCYIALIQFISSTLVTCCLGYMIVTSISMMQDSETDNSALIKAVMFYITSMLEAFIFCICGEYLSAKSKMIGDAAYKSIWYDLKPSESKLILLMISRSQRRLTITAGKIMDLSLEGFTSILKASVSYVSVLHAMY